jgi:hypothetical protein
MDSPENVESDENEEVSTLTRPNRRVASMSNLDPIEEIVGQENESESDSSEDLHH